MHNSIVKQRSTNSCHFSIPTNSLFTTELPAKYYQEFSWTVSSTTVNTRTTYCNIKELRTVPIEHIYVFHMVEELRYKPTGREIYSRWDHWDFSLAKFFRPYYSSGVDSASNRNEYQKYFVRGRGARSVWLTLPPSTVDSVEIWEPQPPGTLKACPGLYWDCFNFNFISLNSVNWLTYSGDGLRSLWGRSWVLIYRMGHEKVAQVRSIA